MDIIIIFTIVLNPYYVLRFKNDDRRLHTFSTDGFCILKCRYFFYRYTVYLINYSYRPIIRKY